MKSLLKDNIASTNAVKLAGLRVGSVVGFGFMPQKSLSGKRASVSEINSYLFAADNFIAYRFKGEGLDVNAVINDGEDSDAYLALSQRIEPRLFSSVFPGRPLLDWFSLKEGDTVEARPPVLGALTGWLAPRYKLLLASSGHLLDGDYRMTGPAERISRSRPFDYVLLADEHNTHALEAEKYKDGAFHVYATVYRPATDIGEIAQVPFDLDAESKPGTIADVLACDLRLAARLIDEALRNQMKLGDVIRKVIDLPAREQDQVLVPFSLNDAELADLARRYKIPVTNAEAIRQKVIEELKQFAGDKK